MPQFPIVATLCIQNLHYSFNADYRYMCLMQARIQDISWGGGGKTQQNITLCSLAIFYSLPRPFPPPRFGASRKLNHRKTFGN